MKSIQYTLRDVPSFVDHALRARAKTEGRSLNSIVVEVLSIGSGVGSEPPRFHDLDEFAGTWITDPAFDAAIADMDAIDEGLWR